MYLEETRMWSRDDLRQLGDDQLVGSGGRARCHRHKGPRSCSTECLCLQNLRYKLYWAPPSASAASPSASASASASECSPSAAPSTSFSSSSAAFSSFSLSSSSSATECDLLRERLRLALRLRLPLRLRLRLRLLAGSSDPLRGFSSFAVSVGRFAVSGAAEPFTGVAFTSCLATAASPSASFGASFVFD